MQLCRNIFMLGTSVVFVLLMTGCGGAKPLPKPEETRNMSLEKFMEAQEYEYTPVDKYYTKDLADFYPYSKRASKLEEHEKLFQAYCGNYGGEIVSSHQFEKMIQQQYGFSREEFSALRIYIRGQLHGYGFDYGSQVCLVKNLPFFWYKSSKDRDSNPKWINAGAVTPWSEIQRNEPLFTAEEIELMRGMIAEKEKTEARQRQDEIERKQKFMALRNRQGDHVFVFYDSAYGSNSVVDCTVYCAGENYGNNAYRTLEDALNDGWALKATIGPAQVVVPSHVGLIKCHCKGGKYVLSK